MRNFQDIFETRKRSFISAFSICVTVSLKKLRCNIVSQSRFEKQLLENVEKFLKKSPS